MNSKLLYFFGGVVGGCVATYIVMNKRMNQRIDAEIAEVKEAYSNAKVAKKDDNDQNEEEDVTGADVKGHEFRTERPAESPRDVAIRNAKQKEELITNSNIIKGNGYADTHKTEYNLFSHPPKARDIHNGYDEDEDLDIVDTTPAKDAPGPYVLEDDDASKASEKFVNEEPYFDKITLFLYDDGVLCSETEEIITDIPGTVGRDSLNRIGEYEPDVVYVRNESISTDYEIIRQYRDFASISGEFD